MRRKTIAKFLPGRREKREQKQKQKLRPERLKVDEDW